MGELAEAGVCDTKAATMLSDLVQASSPARQSCRPLQPHPQAHDTEEGFVASRKGANALPDLRGDPIVT
jgi:hypothetical protein